MSVLNRPPRQNADAGDADLDAGKESRRFRAQRQRMPRAAISRIGHLCEARTPRAHDGDLRHGEHAVQQDQTKEDKNVSQHVILGGLQLLIL